MIASGKHDITRLEKKTGQGKQHFRFFLVSEYILKMYHRKSEKQNFNVKKINR